MSRVKDKDAMAEAREAWTPLGCTICGDAQFDLHHLRKRSAGGPDSPGNLIALCSEFTKHAHHRAVEDHLVEIYPTQGGGLWWQDRKTGESGECRLPTGFRAVGLERAIPHPSSGGNEKRRQPRGVIEVVEDGAPTPCGAPGALTASPLVQARSAPPNVDESAPWSPRQRFIYIQDLSRSAAQDMLLIAVNLLRAKESKEWRELGFESWADYYGEAGLGLSSGTVSKMLRVAAYYGGVWDGAIRSGASVEKLYLAARVDPDPTVALGLAENTPAYVLKGRSREARQEQAERSICPECGRPL